MLTVNRESRSGSDSETFAEIRAGDVQAGVDVLLDGSACPRKVVKVSELNLATKPKVVTASSVRGA